MRTQPRIHANNGDTCRAAALDHQGVILQPDFLVGAGIHALSPLAAVAEEVAAGWLLVQNPSRKSLS